MGLKISAEEYFSLALILLGSIFYAFADHTVTFKGVGWILFNLFLTVTVPILDKKLTNDIIQEQTSTGISTLKNGLSIPFLLVLAYFRGQFSALTVALPALPTIDWIYLGITIFFGTTIGIAYYSLMSLVSATSVVAANVTYKLVTLMVSLVLFPVPFKLYGVFGLFLSFFGVGWFSYMRTVKDQRVVIWKYVAVATVLIFICYLTMAYTS